MACLFVAVRYRITVSFSSINCLGAAKLIVNVFVYTRRRETSKARVSELSNDLFLLSNEFLVAQARQNEGFE